MSNSDGAVPDYKIHFSIVYFQKNKVDLELFKDRDVPAPLKSAVEPT